MPVVSPCRANLVIQCENWWNLAKQFASRSPPLNFLSSPVQRTLMKALVLGGFAHMDTETKQQYWTEVMAPPLSAWHLCIIHEVKVKVAQLCLTLYNPMDYTVHGILQARKPE